MRPLFFSHRAVDSSQVPMMRIATLDLAFDAPNPKFTLMK